MPLESDLERDLVQWCEEHGILCYKVKIEGQRGFPDRLLITPYGETIYCELKRPDGRGRLSAQQEEIVNELKRRYCCVVVTDNLDDVIEEVDCC